VGGEDGRYLGTVSAHEVMDALAAGEDVDVVALTRAADPVPDDAPLDEVLRRLDRGADGVPVADGSGRLVGWVRNRDLLSALSRRTR